MKEPKYRNNGPNPPPYGWKHAVNLEVDCAISKLNQACFAVNDMILYMREQVKNKPSETDKARVFHLGKRLGLVWDGEHKRFHLPEGMEEEWDAVRSELNAHRNAMQTP